MYAISPTPVGPGVMLAAGIFSFPATRALATVVALGNGTLANATLTNNGEGYSSAPAITVSGGGGSGANITASISNGSLTGLTINNAGTGYMSTPTVTVAAPDGLVSHMTIPCPFRTVFGVHLTPLTVAGKDDLLRCNATPVGNVIPNPSIGSLVVERFGSTLTANLSFSATIIGQ